MRRGARGIVAVARACVFFSPGPGPAETVPADASGGPRRAGPRCVMHGVVAQEAAHGNRNCRLRCVRAPSGGPREIVQRHAQGMALGFSRGPQGPPSPCHQKLSPLSRAAWRAGTPSVPILPDSTGTVHTSRPHHKQATRERPQQARPPTEKQAANPTRQHLHGHHKQAANPTRQHKKSRPQTLPGSTQAF